MKYNKLVRDKIPEIIRKDDKEPVTYVADKEEYFLKLKEKLREEVTEFLESNKVEELADILEIVYTLAENYGISREKLEGIREVKAEERGGFKEKLILEEVKE